jgi:surface antigen
METALMQKLVPVVALALALAACAQPGTGSGLSPAPGATAPDGAATGAQFATGSGNPLLTPIGASTPAAPPPLPLDKADADYASRTAQRGFETAPTGQSVAWTNPDTGNRGTLTPTRTYQMPSGQYCREFTQTITVGGKTREGIGTACRQPDGSWRVQN